jgi:hypothetical protein
MCFLFVEFFVSSNTYFVKALTLAPWLLGTRNGNPNRRRRQRPRVQGWASLPRHLQEEILDNGALTFHDLAKAAMTCRIFFQKCLERLPAEEQWLANLATSGFGAEAVGRVVPWLCLRRQRGEPVAHFPRVQINNQNPWPDQARLNAIEAVGIEAPPGQQLGQLPVLWSLHHSIGSTHIRGYMPIPRNSPILEVDRSNGMAEFWSFKIMISNELVYAELRPGHGPHPMAPCSCISLLYKVCLRVADGRRTSSPPFVPLISFGDNPFFPNADPLIPWTRQVLENRRCWQDVRGAPEDMQRALIAFYVWLNRTGRHRIRVIFRW